MTEAWAVAQKLRLALATTVDEVDRQGTIRAVLDQETKDLSTDQRREVLDRLRGFFPIWGEIIINDPKSKERIDPGDAKALAAALAVAFPKLSESERAEVRKTLGPEIASASLPEAVVGRVEKLFGRLRPPNVPSVETGKMLERLVDLCWVMVQQMVGIDENVSQSWKIFRGEGNGPLVRDLTARYLFGPDNEPGRGRIGIDLEQQVKQRIIKLLYTMRSFAQRYAQTRSPATIEDDVGAPGLLSSKYKPIWEEYIKLCGGREAENLESIINTMIRKIISEM